MVQCAILIHKTDVTKFDMSFYQVESYINMILYPYEKIGHYAFKRVIPESCVHGSDDNTRLKHKLDIYFKKADEEPVMSYSFYSNSSLIYVRQSKIISANDSISLIYNSIEDLVLIQTNFYN